MYDEMECDTRRDEMRYMIKLNGNECMMYDSVCVDACT